MADIACNGFPLQTAQACYLAAVSLCSALLCYPAALLLNCAFRLQRSQLLAALILQCANLAYRGF